MFCPKCNTSYSVKRTVINLQNLPVDEIVEATFCPVCGWTKKEDEIIVNGINIFDQVERYSHCIVEVLSNSITGETSVGWYRTNETEEIEDEDFTFKQD